MSQRPGAIDVFRKYIRSACDFLTENSRQRNGQTLFGPLLPGDKAPTVAEMAFVLTAFHDGLRGWDRLTPIAPDDWPVMVEACRKSVNKARDTAAANAPTDRERGAERRKAKMEAERECLRMCPDFLVAEKYRRT